MSTPADRDGDPASVARDADRRIRELQVEADRLAGEARTLLGEVRTLAIERDIRVQAVRRADATLGALQRDIAAREARVAALEAERVAASRGVRERLVEIYKRGHSGYLGLLFGAGDLQAFGRLSRAVAAVAGADQRRFDAHRRAVVAEQQAVADLEARRRQQAVAQAEAVERRGASEAAIAAHNRRLAEVDAQRDLAAQYAGELQNATAALERQVDGVASGTAPGLPLAPFRGALEWPVRGRVLAPFGPGREGNRSPAVQRNGIDIGAAEDTPVHAVHGGRVVFAAPFLGFGTLVIVDHGAATFSVYGHLARAEVSEGMRVERGATVGRSGRTPEGVAALYFEVRVEGQPVNPVEWLRPF